MRITYCSKLFLFRNVSTFAKSTGPTYMDFGYCWKKVIEWVVSLTCDQTLSRSPSVLYNVCSCYYFAFISVANRCKGFVVLFLAEINCLICVMALFFKFSVVFYRVDHSFVWMFRCSLSLSITLSTNFLQEFYFSILHINIDFKQVINEALVKVETRAKREKWHYCIHKLLKWLF